MINDATLISFSGFRYMTQELIRLRTIRREYRICSGNMIEFYLVVEDENKNEYLMLVDYLAWVASAFSSTFTATKGELKNSNKTLTCLTNPVFPSPKLFIRDNVPNTLSESNRDIDSKYIALHQYPIDNLVLNIACLSEFNQGYSVASTMFQNYYRTARCPFELAEHFILEGSKGLSISYREIPIDRIIYKCDFKIMKSGEEFNL